MINNFYSLSSLSFHLSFNIQIFPQTCTILLVYGQNRHNLTLTADILDKVKPEMKTHRKSLYLPPKDIPLLQELTFIQHRSEILTYLETLQQEETMEFQRLKV